MYGTQTNVETPDTCTGFENDVKMYGTQTEFDREWIEDGLRMM